MTEHEKFQNLMDKLDISREELADYIGLKKSSARNQLAPGTKVKKPLPRWAKSMLLVAEKIEDQG